MVATVGSISIDLSTNAAKFASGFTSSAATVEAQSARMRKSIAAVEETTVLAGDKFKEFGVGLAAGTGLAAVFSLESAFEKLKETVSEYDEIIKNSKTTGLRTDTYQALSFAAKQAGIDQETFNSSLDIFAKNSGLAARGTGALYSGLKTLNPQLLQAILNTKDQEERLKLVADAMANTTDATQKAALATIIFGKGGIDMTRILEQGRAEIEKFKKTALSLGVIIPDDFLKRAAEIKEQLTTLGRIIDVNVGEALINLSPVLLKASEGFAGFSKELNEFSTLVANFQSNPDLENLLRLINGGAAGGGLIDNAINKTQLRLNGGDITAIQASIDFMEKKLSELRSQAAQGADVHVEIGEAVQSLDELKVKLGEVAEVVGPVAKTISTQFAQAFREAENASMDALAAMQDSAAQILPTVHRYGGDPNKITLPDQRNNYQPNANGSGVGVTSYKSSGPWQNPNGATAAEWAQLTPQNKQDIYDGKTTYDKILYGTDKTVDNTQQTADNVSKLDTNTKSYLQSLSSDIGGYSAQQSITINKLSDVTAQTFGMLSTSILAALVQKNDTADGSAAGPGFLTHDQVFIPGMTSYGRNVGHVVFPSTASDGTSNNSVSVAQPGTSITLNYVASPGESEQTAKQRARDMFNELVRAQASA